MNLMLKLQHLLLKKKEGKSLKISEIYSIVCSSGIQPNYFLDEMNLNEASYIIKKNEDDYIDSWNKTRFIAYSIIQSQSTTSLLVTDVMKFPWEDDDKEILPTKSIEELRKYSLEMEKNNNKKNGSR